MAKQRRRQKGTGSVRPKGRGWESLITVNGAAVRKQWDQEPTNAQLLAWCVAERAAQRPAAEAGSFEADVAAYLGLIAAQPSHGQVAAHLEQWLRELGRDRHRRTITSQDVDRVIQRWLVTPTRPAPGQRGRPSGPKGLAAETIRRRCNSLRMLFVKLDGREATNPVRGATKPRVPPPQRRGLDSAVIAQILAAMPVTRMERVGGIVQPSLAPIRAAVLAYTGLPPNLVRQIKATDLDFVGRTIRVPERHKGGGVESRILPMVPQAFEALRAFHAANAYGGKPGTYKVVAAAFKRAAARLGIDPRTLRLYDLRHSFGEDMYRSSRGDLATVARFLMHAKGSPITARYAMGADDDVNRLAAAAFGETVAQRIAEAQTPQAPAVPAAAGGYLPPILATRRKTRRIKHLRVA
jgi:integrase